MCALGIKSALDIIIIIIMSSKDWKNKWKAKGQSFTHLLLSGGKLLVDDQQHATFLNEYANAIARGNAEHIVETKTPIFRLFIDFDFSPPPEPCIVDAAVLSACKVASYYFDVDSDAVILKKTATSANKVGVHVTWDDVFVDAATANAYRAHLVSKLEDACPDIVPPWKTVVDAAVFGGTGLRMSWSRKRDAPGVYVPVQTCRVDVLSDVPAISTAFDIRTWVRRTSIRAPGAVPTRSCIVTAPPPPSPSSSASTSQYANVSEYAEALSAFQKTLPEPYRDQRFVGIHLFGDFCVILRSSSKKCGNKNFAEHLSSTVYFVVLKKGHAYQRCYCRKDELRGSGITCTDYAGDPWTLPQEVLDLFWPPPPKPVIDMLKVMDRTRPALKAKKSSLKKRADAQ